MQPSTGLVLEGIMLYSGGFAGFIYTLIRNIYVKYYKDAVVI